MIHFLKKQLGLIVPLAPLFQGGIDVHSHLLFGTDDGSESLAESLLIAQSMRNYGMKGVFCTPHIMETVSLAEMNNRLPHFNQLCQETKGIIDLRLAGEYMLEKEFEEALEKGVSTFNGSHLLIEMSYLFGSPRLFESIYAIQQKGLTPILAHPERYLYLPTSKVEELTKRRCKLQLNLPSLLGFYGERVKDRASRWLLEGRYHYVGSDTHSFKNWTMVAEAQIEKRFMPPLRELLDNNIRLWES